MDLESLWNKALKETDMVRMHLRGLSSTETTILPYVFLAESSMNRGDTLVRRGQIAVQKPQLILPNFSAEFKGFDFEENMSFNPDTIMNFLLVRGVHFPSLKYNNATSSMDVYEAPLSKAIEQHKKQLEQKEDVTTTLLKGPEEAWQFSVLLFVGSQFSKSAERDIKSIMDRIKRDRPNR
jgi:hypothetical protein